MSQYFNNDNSIQSNVVKTYANILGESFTFYTDNGVFSKNGVDFGTRLLLESIPLDSLGDSLLDVGCGYGVFGVVLNKKLGIKCTMCDVNKRALHLTKRNIEEKTTLIYPGSTISMGFDELNSHGMVVGNLEKGKLKI